MADYKTIRVAISVGHHACGHLTITNDETGTAEIGNYDVVFDQYRDHRQIHARIECWPRTERNGLELIGQACKAIVEAEGAAVIP